MIIKIEYVIKKINLISETRNQARDGIQNATYDIRLLNTIFKFEYEYYISKKKKIKVRLNIR